MCERERSERREFQQWQKGKRHTNGQTFSVTPKVENNKNENGKFRILVTPDPTMKIWPTALKTGTGVKGFGLLNTVPIWYELWRQINGFPPDYYKPSTSNKKQK